MCSIVRLRCHFLFKHMPPHISQPQLLYLTIPNPPRHTHYATFSTSPAVRPIPCPQAPFPETPWRYPLSSNRTNTPSNSRRARSNTLYTSKSCLHQFLHPALESSLFSSFFRLALAFVQCLPLSYRASDRPHHFQVLVITRELSSASDHPPAIYGWMVHAQLLTHQGATCTGPTPRETQSPHEKHLDSDLSTSWPASGSRCYAELQAPAKAALLSPSGHAHGAWAWGLVTNDLVYSENHGHGNRPVCRSTYCGACRNRLLHSQQ